MRAVVTGSTGYIGACLVRRLIDKGVEVVSLSVDPEAQDGIVQHVQADIRDCNKVSHACRGADVVFHLAGAIGITKDQNAFMFDVNVNGSRTVALAAREEGIKRMIHVSSLHAFDQEPLGESIDELRPYISSNSYLAYDRSKAEAEMAVKEIGHGGLEVVVINPAGVIGPYDPGTSHMGHIIRKMFEGKLPFVIKGGFNWIDVRDVVTSVESAVERGRAGENYILGGHWCQMKTLSKKIARMVGLRRHSVVVPTVLAKMTAPLAVKWNQMLGKKCYFTPYSIAALKSNPHVDDSKARRELGHSPRPLEETLEDIRSWLSES